MPKSGRQIFRICIEEMRTNRMNEWAIFFVMGTSLAFIKHDTKNASPSPTTIYDDNSVERLDYSFSGCIR